MASQSLRVSIPSTRQVEYDKPWNTNASPDHHRNCTKFDIAAAVLSPNSKTGDYTWASPTSAKEKKRHEAYLSPTNKHIGSPVYTNHRNTMELARPPNGDKKQARPASGKPRKKPNNKRSDAAETPHTCPAVDDPVGLRSTDNKPSNDTTASPHPPTQKPKPKRAHNPPKLAFTKTPRQKTKMREQKAKLLVTYGDTVLWKEKLRDKDAHPSPRKSPTRGRSSQPAAVRLRKQCNRITEKNANKLEEEKQQSVTISLEDLQGILAKHDELVQLQEKRRARDQVVLAKLSKELKRVGRFPKQIQNPTHDQSFLASQAALMADMSSHEAKSSSPELHIHRYCDYVLNIVPQLLKYGRENQGNAPVHTSQQAANTTNEDVESKDNGEAEIDNVEASGEATGEAGPVDHETPLGPIGGSSSSTTE